MGSLYIGPVEIQLSGTGFSHFVTTRDFGPFLYERDTESCIELTFVSSDDSRLQKYEFCYRRHDLNFVSDGRHAYAWISGDVSGFLACLELALFVGVNQIGGVLVHASVAMRETILSSAPAIQVYYIDLMVVLTCPIQLRTRRMMTIRLSSRMFAPLTLTGTENTLSVASI